MIPSVKLVVIISKMGEEASLLGELVCLSSSSLHSSRQTAGYISCPLAPINFL